MRSSTRLISMFEMLKDKDLLFMLILSTLGLVIGALACGIVIGHIVTGLL
jgi:hypothetical protein